MIVTPLILVLMMGALQFAILYRAKLTLNLATFEAARSGAVAHASFESIDNGLSRSMLALYSPDPDPVNEDVFDRVGFERALELGEFIGRQRDALPWRFFEPNDSSSPVCIERLNPPEEAFAAFDYPDAPGELPNDNLMFRNQSIALPSGSMTIQDANLLHIRVSYCHPMIVPVAGRLIANVMLFGSDSAEPVGNRGEDLNNYLVRDASGGGQPTTVSTFQRLCLDGDLLDDTPYGFPLVSEAIVRMHSNPRSDVPFINPSCAN